MTWPLQAAAVKARHLAETTTHGHKLFIIHEYQGVQQAVPDAAISRAAGNGLQAAEDNKHLPSNNQVQYTTTRLGHKGLMVTRAILQTSQHQVNSCNKWHHLLGNLPQLQPLPGCLLKAYAAYARA
jgi:hypothetical protein